MALPAEKLNRLNLGTRRVSFQRELADMKLPNEATALIEMAQRERERSIEGKYNLIFIFNQLERKGGNYWTEFGCRSVEEMLTRFDLPITATLARWSVTVQLFSKETILTLGEESLFLMQRMVSVATSDPDQRKRDYQAIFDEYNRTHNAFDKIEFEKTVNWYINTRYVKPSGVRVTDNTAKPQLALTGATNVVRNVRRIERDIPQTQHPILTSDFVIERKVDNWRDAALKHIELLESVIRKGQGKQFVPERPAILR